MKFNELIENIENIESLQDSIDSELMENGGEVTVGIEAKIKAVKGLMEVLIERGIDDSITTVTHMTGKVDTLKLMKKDVENAIHSSEKLLARFKKYMATLLSVQDVGALKGSLGSIKVVDKKELLSADAELVEDEYKFMLVKYEKTDYDKAEFKLAKIITEVSKKEELDKTRGKNDGAKGFNVDKFKTVTIYKKRGKKDD